jgi:hypothetical protein
MKFAGTLTLQFSGTDGCGCWLRSARMTFNCARWPITIWTTACRRFAELVGTGRLAVTVQWKSPPRNQGIVRKGLTWAMS